ncbi:MAG: antitoxin Xre/MbcA/ParS toxin-binding domain-containing protein [Pseudomonadota bacterium]|nr:antitoxin Xre/MbcA/ParS toxin-binding domain-containing protein [Pseudomonadota bacterium]
MEQGEFSKVTSLLGGEATLRQAVNSPFEAHELIKSGIPSGALSALRAHIADLPFAAVERVVGISLRTVQRHEAEGGKRRLSTEQSGRAWKFAEILGKATEVFGTQAAAEDWLKRPALALDQRTPLELLSTPAGTKLVEDHLTRLEYGVYE